MTAGPTRQPLRWPGRRALIAVTLVAAAPLLAAQDDGRRVTESLVRAHMEMLASDALQGRGSGTAAEWVAATYAAAELRRSGFEPLGSDGSFLQPVETPLRELTRPPQMLLPGSARTFMHGVDMVVTAIADAHVAGPLHRLVRGAAVPAGAVVLVADRDPVDASAVSTAVAVLTPETPAIRARWQRLAELRQLIPLTGRPWRVTLNDAAIASLADVADGTPVTLDTGLAPVRTWNVLGRLTGRDDDRADETVMLSAHLDHLGVAGTGPDRVFNGADDDASGVTAVLALARALAADRPRRSILVALFGSEEIGLYGSKHFVDRPPVPLASIVANLSFEMIGRPDPAVPKGALWLTGFERTTLGPMLAARGARLFPDPHPAENFFFRSDNIELAYRGVIAQTVSSFGLHEDYHTVSDDLSRIDFAHLTAAIQSLVAPVRWLADSSFRPTWRPNMQPQPRGQRPQ